MSVLNTYKNFLMERYDNFPHGRYVTLLILRQAQSEVIFRTEGSGEGLSFDTVQSGSKKNPQPMQRAVITKRKQVAVERRMGRELLREHDLLFYKGGAKTGKADEICALNRNMPCEHCIDCMLYGFAAGGGGAQKSRVMTDDAFSLHPFAKVTAQRTFNGLFDNSTMRDPVDGSPSTSIQSDEYVKPGALFVDMQTLKDVTQGEMIYALANVMRSRRYGAISSRMGKMRNILVGVLFSDCELFSNLELTQAVYDRLMADKDNKDVWPLAAETAAAYMSDAVGELLSSVVGQKHAMTSTEVQQLEEEIATLYAGPDSIKNLLRELTASYPKNGR